MGVLQVNEITQESLLDRFKKDSLKQADKIYTYSHFRIGDKSNEYKTKALILLLDVMSNDNCEVTKFLNKKLRGALTDDNIEIADLKTVQTKYRDINNYYIGKPLLWEKSEW